MRSDLLSLRSKWGNNLVSSTLVKALMIMVALLLQPDLAIAQAMPIGNLNGWRQIFADDFNRSTLGSNWGIYEGYPGASPDTKWELDHVVVRDGNLELLTDRNSTESGKCASGGVSTGPSQVYGKYLVKFRCDALTNSAGSRINTGVECIGLLWPSADVWPPEIDFFEDFSGDRLGTTATLHYLESGVHEMVHSSLTNIDTSQWHVLGVEWTAGTVKYTVDGQVWATVANRGVPNIAHHLALQTQLTDGYSCPSTQIKMQVDWVVMYAPDPNAVASNPNPAPTPDPTPASSPTPIPSPTPSQSTSGTNLLKNPGFEAGMAYWENWGRSSAVKGHARGGGYSLKTGSREGGAAQNVLAKLVPGRRYTLTGYAKVSKVGERSYFGITLRNGSTTVLEKFATITSTSYKRIRVDFTAPTGIDFGYVYQWKDTGVGGYACLDDVRLVEAMAP